MRPTTSQRRAERRAAEPRDAAVSRAPLTPSMPLGALAIAVAAALAGCSNAEPEAARAAPIAQPQPAARAAPAQAPAPAAAAAEAAPTGTDPADATRDPFAGVDPSQNDVLRNIARLDPGAAGKAGARPAPPARPPSNAGSVESAGAASTPAASASAPVAAPAVLPPSATAASALAAPATPPPAATVTAGAEGSTRPGAPGAAGTVATPAAGSLAPATIAAPAAAAPRRAIAQPRPEFPREALREGINEGRVLARIEIGVDGRVTDVAVLSATPSRAFGRAAQQALRDWRYEPAAAASSAQVELVFRTE